MTTFKTIEDYIRSVGTKSLDQSAIETLADMMSEASIWELLRAKYNYAYFPILLDYPVTPQPRYGWGKPPHKGLYDVISKNRKAYGTLLQRFVCLREELAGIPQHESRTEPGEPCWISEWFSGLDAVSVYGLLATGNPARYLEIGSGSSTKFARRSIRDRSLRTSVMSIDPQPRAEIDLICDVVIRQPLECVDTNLFTALGEGDVLFFDGSHRSFPNSDVTVFFLEILPGLRPGVVVGLHDIFLPYDYPPGWKNRYYSEQYLLAACLLALQRSFDILLPNSFITHDPDLSSILSSLWDDARMQGVETCAACFWMRRK